MKHLLMTVGRVLGISLLAAWPILAQEESPGSDFDEEDFEGAEFGDRGGGAERGRDTGGPSPVDRAREIFTKSGHPLDESQIASLQAFLNEQREARRQVIEQAAAEGQPQQAPQGGQGARGQLQARVQRGVGGPAEPAGESRREGPPGQRLGPNPILRQQAEAFLEKLLTLLTPEQQGVWKKYQREQTLARGGYPALRLALEEAGAPPSPEQEIQLEELFRSYTEQLRRLREGLSEGAQPDAAQLKAAEDTHLAQVAKLLNPAQRRALLEWRRSTQKPGG